MKIQAINSYYSYGNNNQAKIANNSSKCQTRTNQSTFKGNLDAWDKTAGTICGVVGGIVVTAVAGPFVGILAGILGGKAAAEANSESRP